MSVVQSALPDRTCSTAPIAYGCGPTAVEPVDTSEVDASAASSPPLGVPLNSTLPNLPLPRIAVPDRSRSVPVAPAADGNPFVEYLQRCIAAEGWRLADDALPSAFISFVGSADLRVADADLPSICAAIRAHCCADRPLGIMDRLLATLEVQLSQLPADALLALLANEAVPDEVFIDRVTRYLDGLVERHDIDLNAFAAQSVPAAVLREMLRTCDMSETLQQCLENALALAVDDSINAAESVANSRQDPKRAAAPQTHASPLKSRAALLQAIASRCDRQVPAVPLTDMLVILSGPQTPKGKPCYTRLHAHRGLMEALAPGLRLQPDGTLPVEDAEAAALILNRLHGRCYAPVSDLSFCRLHTQAAALGIAPADWQAEAPKDFAEAHRLFSTCTHPLHASLYALVWPCVAQVSAHKERKNLRRWGQYLDGMLQSADCPLTIADRLNWQLTTVRYKKSRWVLDHISPTLLSREQHADLQGIGVSLRGPGAGVPPLDLQQCAHVAPPITSTQTRGGGTNLHIQYWAQQLPNLQWQGYSLRRESDTSTVWGLYKHGVKIAKREATWVVEKSIHGPVQNVGVRLHFIVQEIGPFKKHY